MDEHQARYKLLKLQPNSSCKSGVFLNTKTATLFSKENIVEVNGSGINIQPAFNKAVGLNTLNIKGPLYKQSVPPGDFIPGPANTTPRKEFAVPFELELESMISTLSSLVRYIS